MTQKTFQCRFYPMSEQETLLRLVKNMVRNWKLSLSISKLNARSWNCPQYRTHHNRDINVANNILAAFSGGESLSSEPQTRSTIYVVMAVNLKQKPKS